VEEADRIDFELLLWIKHLDCLAGPLPAPRHRVIKVNSRRPCEIHNLPLLFAQFGCTLPVRFFVALKEG
jgi:hypothetical protein